MLAFIKSIAKVLCTLLVGGATAYSITDQAGYSFELQEKNKPAPGDRELPFVPLVEDRIIDLPEDGDVWHTSLFVHTDWETRRPDRRLVAAFETEERLQSLKAQTKFHLYTSDDPHYLNVFKPYIATLPAVVVQRSDGQIVFKKSGPDVAKSPGELGRAIGRAVRDCCPYRPQPQPQPQPEPEPRPEPIPDIEPDPEPEEENTEAAANPLVALIVSLLAAAGGVATEWKKTG